MIKIFKSGTSVKIKHFEIEGVIGSTSIKYDSVLYEVVYYIDQEQHSVWCHEQELETCEKQKKSIGYK